MKRAQEFKFKRKESWAVQRRKKEREKALPRLVYLVIRLFNCTEALYIASSLLPSALPLLPYPAQGS